MTYELSFLDKSPIDGQESATQALRRTLALARKAESLGFKRFWVAEHHNAPGVAGSSPEVLISFLLAQTSRIRIGSGGVMLQHYSPYKVAENFNLLSALAPDRVDLGIGKAPGGLPLSTRALQSTYEIGHRPDFDALLEELDGFLASGSRAATDVAKPVAYPLPEVAPSRFLLGASPESARLAARLGWSFVYAGHIHGDDTAISEALSAYRESGGPYALLAVTAVVAGSDQEAEQIKATERRFRVRLENGQSVNVGTEEQAAEFARQAGATHYHLEERRSLVIRGGPQRVQAQLHQLHRRFGINEFIIDCPVTEEVHRLKAIEYLTAHSNTAAA